MTLLSLKLADADAERVRRNHEQAIRELQGANRWRVIESVQIGNSATVPVPHGGSRAPVFVAVSCVRGASSSGRVEEVRDGSYDRNKFVTLKAVGYGATITVDVLVVG